jgi:hypothetical protein
MDRLPLAFVVTAAIFAVVAAPTALSQAFADNGHHTTSTCTIGSGTGTCPGGSGTNGNTNQCQTTTTTTGNGGGKGEVKGTTTTC